MSVWREHLEKLLESDVYPERKPVYTLVERKRFHNKKGRKGAPRTKCYYVSLEIDGLHVCETFGETQTHAEEVAATFAIGFIGNDDTPQGVSRWLQTLKYGRETEERVRLAFEETGATFPDGILSIERAGEMLDIYGVDFVVKTFEGSEIYLQVKSSSKGIGRFFESPRRTEIMSRLAIVVVRRRDSPECIRARVANALTEVRQRLAS